MDWKIREGFSLALPEQPTGGDTLLDKHLSGHERDIRAMWRRYFETIAIASRRNPRLQTSKVPLKYRTQFIEFSEWPQGQ
jgi:hypothetical protein